MVARAPRVSRGGVALDGEEEVFAPGALPVLRRGAHRADSSGHELVGLACACRGGLTLRQAAGTFAVVMSLCADCGENECACDATDRSQYEQTNGSMAGPLAPSA